MTGYLLAGYLLTGYQVVPPLFQALFPAGHTSASASFCASSASSACLHVHICKYIYWQVVMEGIYIMYILYINTIYILYIYYIYTIYTIYIYIYMYVYT